MATKKTTPPQAPPTVAPKKKAPMGIILIGVVGIMFVALAFATNSASQVAIVDGKITTQIAQVDQCTQSTYTLAVAEGDIEKAAKSCFDALRTVPGVGTVTVYVDNPRIEVGYCESQQVPQVIQTALASTGYLAAQ